MSLSTPTPTSTTARYEKAGYAKLVVVLTCKESRFGESDDRPSENQNWLPPVALLGGSVLIWYMADHRLLFNAQRPVVCCLYGARFKIKKQKAKAAPTPHTHTPTPPPQPTAHHHHPLLGSGAGDWRAGYWRQRQEQEQGAQSTELRAQEQEQELPCWRLAGGSGSSSGSGRGRGRGRRQAAGAGGAAAAGGRGGQGGQGGGRGREAAVRVRGARHNGLGQGLCCFVPYPLFELGGYCFLSPIRIRRLLLCV
jgi:hypothetical protein